MLTPERKSILLAEDDPAMRRFIEVILQKAGFAVLTAEDGLAAMQIAMESEINAVVADAIMPNMSGYDLCRTLKFRRIPCIILSGLTNDETNNDLADIFLIKDAELHENLITALQKIL
jgi:DNA-binding response OmpR family regulator